MNLVLSLDFLVFIVLAAHDSRRVKKEDANP